MPTNPQQLHEALKSIGDGVPASAEVVRVARDKALGMLREVAAAPDQLASAVERAADADPGLRCAAPFEEHMLMGREPPAVAPASPLFAVDGSQASADRHEEVMFAILNVGSVIIEPGSQAVPQVLIDTRVLFGDELYTPGGSLINHGDLALLRDAAERQTLLKKAPVVEGLICLSDGPLELWGGKDVSDPGSFERALRQYLDDLRALHRRGATVAGYVDKPAADLVVRSLEVMQVAPGQAAGGVIARTLRGAADRWLFAQLLKPSERSAVFALQSSSRTRYTDDLSIHFFYLNVGSQSRPSMARIEIPRWVAANPGRLHALHRALLDQCAFLGARPYPYILHRAHETAAISPQERELIKLRLLLEMRRRGMEPEPASGKSSAKQSSAQGGS